MSEIIKVVVIGDGGVGKTTFLETLIKDNYTDETSLTIGIGLYVMEHEVGGKELIFQVWDLGGQDRFKSLHEKCKSFIGGAKGIILMFDLTRIFTLENIEYWVQMIRSELQDNIPMLFIGAKQDLYNEGSIQIDHIQSIKNQFDFFDYIQISSKNKHNIDKVFDLLANEMLNRNLI